MSPIPGQQPPTPFHHDPGDQAVGHPDRGSGLLEVAAYTGRAIRGRGVEIQGRQRLQQLPDGSLLLCAPRVGEELEKRDDRRGQASSSAIPEATAEAPDS